LEKQEKEDEREPKTPAPFPSSEGKGSLLKT